ncbi:hypothetical protein HS7_18760 [Sulfolobales archaeon HS-7]|nr:hypothetical protein HS7_18760 [Sulfolobales archaeon HS-7]
MKEPLCPRCKIRTDLIKESETLSSGEKVVRYFYKCPVCGTRINISNLLLKHDKDSIVIEKSV